MNNKTNITDIERIAMTLLSIAIENGNAGNLDILDIANRVLNDTEHIEYANDVHPMKTHKAYKAMQHAVGYYRLHDEALCNLIGAISRYRSEGRVDENYTRLSEEIGVASSLSAAICEFHKMEIEAYYKLGENSETEGKKSKR